SYYFKKYSKIVFSITAGLDSRVSLAMLKEYTDKIKFFTYMTEVDNPNNDKNIRLLKNDGVRVKRILEDIKLNHSFIKIESNSGELNNNELEIISKNTVGQHNFGLLKRYSSLFPEKNILHIRSNLNEIGRANLMVRNVGDNIQRVEKYFVNSFKKANAKQLEDTNIDLFEIAHNGINDFHYVDNNRYGYHIMDLYYWENRTGRWISEILNETDICFETFSAYNLRSIIEISLSFSFNDRKESIFFKELINRNYASLNFYGVNSDENLYESYTKLLKYCEEKELSNDSMKEKKLVDYAQKSSEKIYDKINILQNKIMQDSTLDVQNQLNHIMMINKENINFMQENIYNQNNRSISKEIFSNFTINDDSLLLKTVDLNTLFLTKDFLNKGNSAEVRFTFNQINGFLELKLINKYFNSNGKGYLNYVILKNEKELLREDVSNWNHDNNIFIYNLKKDDEIKIKI